MAQCSAVNDPMHKMLCCTGEMIQKGQGTKRFAKSTAPGMMCSCKPEGLKVDEG